MRIKSDMLGRVPEIGDIIVYNPPYYKGLYSRVCLGFSTTGRPIVSEEMDLRTANKVIRKSPPTEYISLPPSANLTTIPIKDGRIT